MRAPAGIAPDIPPKAFCPWTADGKFATPQRQEQSQAPAEFRLPVPELTLPLPELTLPLLLLLAEVDAPVSVDGTAATDAAEAAELVPMVPVEVLVPF